MLSMRSNVAGYAEEAQVFGRVVEVSLVKETITLRDNEDELHVFKVDDVIELLPVGTLDGMGVFQHDLFEGATGLKYEIDLNENEGIELYLLDDLLNRKSPKTPIVVRDLDDYQGVMTLIGNLLEVKSKMKPLEFDLKVVKEVSEEEHVYFYVGNRKESSEVDIIHVSFFGTEMLSSETGYQRITLSYQDFLKEIEEGSLVEVSDQEFANYLTGVMYGVTLDEDGEVLEVLPHKEEKVETSQMFDDEEEDDEYCPQCDNTKEDCGCNIF